MAESQVQQPTETVSTGEQKTAESEVKHPTETIQRDDNQAVIKDLKYLDFVQVAAIYVVVCFSTVYEYAKENSGPLKPGVQTVEGTVKAVIGPVYEKFHGVPFDLLKFADRKVDDSVNELDRHVPSVLKQASSRVLFAAQKAPELAREVASELHRAGLIDGATNIYKNYEPTAKEMYSKYEPVAERYAVLGWRRLNQLPLFPQLAQILIPTAAHWCEKYNDLVSYAAEKGNTVSQYLPLVPIERIAKAFEGSKNGLAISTNGDAVSVST